MNEQATDAIRGEKTVNGWGFSDVHRVEQVRATAQAYLDKRAAEIAPPVPEPEPEPQKPGLPQAPTVEGWLFLYLIASGAMVKIGYAANLYLRYSNLRVDNPHGVVLVAYCEMPKPMAKDIERFVHMALESHRASGEWFTVPVDKARECVERVRGLVEQLYGVSVPTLTSEDFGVGAFQ